MPTFHNDGLELNYVEKGVGAPVLLLHGFGMSAQSCWVETGLIDLLSASGYRAIALDARGHGDSDKPSDPDAYQADRMADDVIACIRHTGIDKAAFIGHSMGGRTVLSLLSRADVRAQAAVVVSNGSNVFQATQAAMLGDALESGETSLLPAPVAEFVNMLIDMGNDTSALAAYCRIPRPALTRDDLSRISIPVKIICGERDFISGDPALLSAAISGSEFLIIEGREHTDVLGSEPLSNATILWLKDHLK